MLIAASQSERDAIADEARDLLAHDLALVGVQLRAARRLIGEDSDAAWAVATAEATCNAALWRLRRLSRLLSQDTAPRYAPHEVSLDVDALRDVARSSGASLETTGDGYLAAVPGDVALSVRRIVELVCSPGARVLVKGHEMGVRLTVRDAPRGADADARIRERVDLLSGTARWGAMRMTIDLPAPDDELRLDVRRSYAAARDQSPHR